MTARRDRPPRPLRPAIRRGGPSAAGAALLVLAMVGCASSAPSQTPAGSANTPPAGSVRASAIASASATGSAVRAGGVPRPAHIVVVVLENHGYSQIIGSPDAPFLNQLAARGALFTHSYAITHPSEPNYLALFSGSTQGVTGDPCPITFSAPNLASGLLAAGKTFAGYAEDLPAPGSLACDARQYARQLAPWAAFRNVPAAMGQPFASFPAADFSRLPTVSFVIPGLCYDMHNCSVATGDAWLRTHLSSYADWAMTHDSLLIVTWDEDDFTTVNHIATMFVGQQVRPGRYAQQITHYSVLATIEAAYGLARDGRAAATAPIDYIWRS
jgi:phosphatidylinositol-3-phosphatase